MRWQYTDYPVWLNGKPTLTSGSVEIEMTKPPKLPRLRAGDRETCIVSRPLEYAKWRVAGDEDEDLKRFIRGKYWTRIETKIQANYLREIGMPWAADEYDKLAA